MTHPPCMYSQFEYLGYTGSVTAPEEDGAYRGFVTDTSDEVTYAASSLEGLRANFQAAVGENIELCLEVASWQLVDERKLSVDVSSGIPGHSRVPLRIALRIEYIRLIRWVLEVTEPVASLRSKICRRETTCGARALASERFKPCLVMIVGNRRIFSQRIIATDDSACQNEHQENMPTVTLAFDFSYRSGEFTLPYIVCRRRIRRDGGSDPCLLPIKSDFCSRHEYSYHKQEE